MLPPDPGDGPRGLLRADASGSGLQRVQEYNTYNAGFVKGYLEHHAAPRENAEEGVTPGAGKMAGQASPSIRRPLKEYSALINQLSLPLTKGESPQ